MDTNLRMMPPTTGASARREDRPARGRSPRRAPRIIDDRDYDRPYTSQARGRDNDLFDYIHTRDRLPRPKLQHRESSREGKRRHEYRYYEPEQQQQQQRRPQRARSAEPRRHSPVRVSERSGGGGRAGRKRMSAVDVGRGGGGGRSDELRRDGRREDDDRRPSRRDDDDRRASRSKSARQSSLTPNSKDDNTGKKRSTAQSLGKAAIAAGALEAMRQQKLKGDDTKEGDMAWKRVATAALGAAAVDAVATKARGKDPRDRGKKETLGASIGGLVVEGLVHKMRS